MKTLLTGALFALLLTACETVDNRREMKDAQVEIKGLIEEAIGVEPLVGFNLSGGALVDVSVGFNAGDVPDRSVSELVRGGPQELPVASPVATIDGDEVRERGGAVAPDEVGVPAERAG